VVQHPGFFLSQDDDAPCAIREAFEHRWLPALRR
jgi:hypothetical protein